jgi:hypothetical protein
LLVWTSVALRFRALALAACSLIFGTIAAFISEELFVSWGFLAIDVTLVLLSATATVAMATAWQRFNGRTR